MSFVKTIHVHVHVQVKSVKSVIVKFSCSSQGLDSVLFTLVKKKYTLAYFKKYFLLFYLQLKYKINITLTLFTYMITPLGLRFYRRAKYVACNSDRSHFLL